MIQVVLVMAIVGSSADDSAAAALIDAAETARQNGDAASVRRFLRGWASLPDRRDVPPALEPYAAEALRFVERGGALRLYGSWRDGEVRVGLSDPAGVVSGIDVWAVADGRRAQLTQDGETPDGGRIYRLDAEAGRRVVLEAYVRLGDRRWVLTTTELRPEQVSLPAAPDPEVLASRLAPVTEEKPPVPERPAAVRWWWVVASLAAAAVTGLAVANEAR